MVAGHRRRPARPLRAALALALACVVLGACELRTELNIAVEEDGTGTVEFALALDADAMNSRPDLAESLDLADLADRGWAVSGPTLEADGRTWFRATKPFDDPAGLTGLVGEVAGDGGPFGEFALVTSSDFSSTTYEFTGTVDFTSGAAGAMADPELAEILGDEPAVLLENRLGAVIDEIISVQVAVRLPGDVTANAPTILDNGAIWRPSVLERDVIELRATGVVEERARVLWLVAAVGFGVVLVAAAGTLLWRRRRRRRATDPLA